MTRSPFHDLAHSIITAWQSHREARQRAKRWSRLCRAVPELSAASENLSKHRKAHKQTRADLARIKAQMTERLRGEVSHG
jgi:hypothetical protein